MKKRFPALLLALVLSACAPAAPASAPGANESASPVPEAASSPASESAPEPPPESAPAAADADAGSPEASESEPPDAPSGPRNYGPEGSGKEVGPLFLYVEDPDAKTYITPLIFATDEEESDMPVNWTTPQMLWNLEPLTRCDAATRESVLEAAAAVTDYDDDETKWEFLTNSPVYLVHRETGTLANAETEFSLYKLGPGMSPYVLMAATGGESVCIPLEPIGPLLLNFRVTDADPDGSSEILLRSLGSGRYASWQAALYKVKGGKLEPLYSFGDFDSGFTVTTAEDGVHYTVENAAAQYSQTFSYRSYGASGGEETILSDIQANQVLQPKNPTKGAPPFLTRIDAADLDGDGVDEFLIAEMAGAGETDWGRKFAILKYDAASNAMQILDAAFLPRSEGVFLNEWLDLTDRLYFTGSIQEN